MLHTSQQMLASSLNTSQHDHNLANIVTSRVSQQVTTQLRAVLAQHNPPERDWNNTSRDREWNTPSPKSNTRYHNNSPNVSPSTVPLKEGSQAWVQAAIARAQAKKRRRIQRKEKQSQDMCSQDMFL